MKATSHKVVIKSGLLALAAAGATIFISSCVAPVGPSGRSEIRQETRVENRVDDRYDRRRGR